MIAFNRYDHIYPKKGVSHEADWRRSTAHFGGGWRPISINIAYVGIFLSTDLDLCRIFRHPQVKLLANLCKKRIPGSNRAMRNGWLR